MEKYILFENNLVYTRIMGSPTYGALILPVSEIYGGAVGFLVPYNDTNTWECETHLLKHISFIPLDFKEIFTALGVEIPKDIPLRLAYFHELQNWYQLAHQKPFVDIEHFDDEDGDVWVRLSKEFRKFCGVEEEYQELVEQYHKEHP